ncbi:DUF1232 domain-containing protein [Dissulfurirhabdus thermomarina]|uniref:DUF1232 domain-containing protein n=1 Tax=Dissulfurirhabdus thermomarina TaxID=1765737 RepID=A0A6N9TMY5_DISTH|nr:DUF1232 domain-containing protein [Dissulfurirhabdus thermomarina]NDY42651.1 DUF1232 domain-containing protein [Dissulfurirhabdus thermomarina]NMX23103.1 DUF1232 domain-containing protein [Dissulfurirhabdus thermomarina]
MPPAFDTEVLRRAARSIPKFLALLVNLLRDPRVSAGDKAILGATVAYLLNPVDLVPDWIPFLGMVDDVYLVALALLRLLVRTDEAVLREHWRGEGDIVRSAREIAELAIRFLPERIRHALLAKVNA